MLDRTLFSPEASSIPTKIIVHSFDFDGMLAGTHYIEKICDLLKDNPESQLNIDDFEKFTHELIALEPYQKFFDERFSQAHRNYKHYLMVGSNRQNAFSDTFNAFKKNDDITLSCYLFFTSLAKVLQKKYQVDISLDKLLMDDIYHEQEIGTTFNAVCETYFTAKKKNLNIKTHYEIIKAKAPWENIDLVDKEKIILIYTQMHYAKNKFDPEDKSEFEFEFVDDNYDILNCLSYVFNESEVLPGTLKISQFVINPELIQNHKEFVAVNISPSKINCDPSPFVTFTYLRQQFFTQHHSVSIKKSKTPEMSKTDRDVFLKALAPIFEDFILCDVFNKITECIKKNRLQGKDIDKIFSILILAEIKIRNKTLTRDLAVHYLSLIQEVAAYRLDTWKSSRSRLFEEPIVHFFMELINLRPLNRIPISPLNKI